MSLLNAARCLASLSKVSTTGAASVCISQLQSHLSSTRAYASEATLSKKEVVYLLDNRDDPEVDTAVRAYLKAAYKNAKAPDTSKPEEGVELANRVEQKYMAAQVVEYGIQNVSVPLSWERDGSTAPVKRFVSELLNLGAQAGFEAPAVEVEKRVSEQAQTAETVKDLLVRIQPYTSADFHAALSEAAVAVEAETNSTITTDSASEGYKKFADKVKGIADAHSIPWKLLLDAKQAGKDEDASDKVNKQYAAFLQAASLKDAVAELESLKVDATALLDKHLSKTAEQVRKEQETAMAQLHKKIDNAKGAKWAEQFKQDINFVKWFDNTVSSNPASGPRASA